MKKIVEMYCELPQTVRKPLWRVWHNLLIKFDKNASEVFMNYGYASKNGEFSHLQLKNEDMQHRYFIQLYDFVTRNHKFENTRVLEVGSGRGGGASFLSRYKNPTEYIAMDISQKIIDFCNGYYKIPNLKFIKGEAEKIPFGESEFDALVNVESARCYGSIQTFFNEVYRVLKPGGKFLFADMIKKEDVGAIMEMLAATGFIMHDKVDIRENVVMALQLNSEQNKKVIAENVPKFLRSSFNEFAGVEGTNRYNSFYSSEMNYYSFTLEKPVK